MAVLLFAIFSAIDQIGVGSKVDTSSPIAVDFVLR